MTRSHTLALIICLIAFAPNAWSVQPTVTTLTLDHAIDRAMLASPQVHALQASAQAQENQAQSEKNRWLGELMLNGGVAINGDDTLIRPITSEMLSAGVATMPFDDQYAFWSLTYRMPVYSGGSVSGSRNAARLIATASVHNMSRAVLAIRHRVLTTYISILTLDEQIIAWQEELKALESLLNHIELGQKAGKYSRVDFLKTKVQQQNTLTRNQALQMSRETSYAALLVLMGEPRDSVIQFNLQPVPEADISYEQLSATALLDSALIRRSDLQAMKDLAAAQRFNVSVMSGSRLPQVSIGGNFSGAHGGNIDFDDTFWSINAMVSLPLLDMGRRKNLSAKANQIARNAEFNVQDLEGLIRAEVTAAFAAVTNSRNNILTQQTTLELADEISRLDQLRYDSGRGDIDNLLKSLSNRRIAEAALTQSRHDLLIALNNLQLTIEGECR